MNRSINILRMIIVIAIVVGIYWGWNYLKNPHHFPIKTVKVDGNFQHISQQSLQAIITPYVQHGFFNFNADKLQLELAAQPWIASITIQRIWPSTVLINIEEQQAVARWNNYALINSAGALFSPPTTTFPQHLPILKGTDDQEPLVWQYYQQLSQLLVPLSLRIAELDFSSRQSIELTLSNGIHIMLGRDDVLTRLQRFVTIYPQLFNNSARAQVIDLRYDNGLAIEWGK